MSKQFYVISRETKEKWKPSKTQKVKQYLVMYDSGYVAVVTEDLYTTIAPLNPQEWMVLHKDRKEGN